jgi:NAD(P)-dependent dehydrogenase (short-subunit alcohol dehydrogenase family)
MLLDDKVAVIYGGGVISEAVATAFAGEGARVFLAGRNQARLEAVAAAVGAVGGRAGTAVLDALDEPAVDDHAASVAAAAGSIDISMNLISMRDVQGIPLVDMTLADFERPVLTMLRSTFLTARAAARQMIRQGGGVVLMFGGYGDPPRGHHVGGLQVAFQALDAFRRNLAAELGPHGIRVVTLQTGGIGDSLPADFEGRDALAAQLAGATMLGRTAALADVGNAACFAASDWARTVTATAINITCGARPD